MSLTLTPSRVLPTVDAFIQCAMVMEAQPFLDALTPLPGADAVETLNVGAEGHHQQSYALGQLAGHTVLVITSGVGIANAAAAVARGLTMATPKIVIAGGTAGGLEGGIKVGDVAGAISTIYNDADDTAILSPRKRSLPAFAPDSPTRSRSTWKPVEWRRCAGPMGSTGSACAPSRT